MILVVCSTGHVLTSVSQAIESLDEPARPYVSGEDVCAQASGCRAIVYVPEPRLLDAYGRPRRELEEVPTLASAARATGVERVVVIEPADVADEGTASTPSAVPISVVRCAPLVDELADATNLHVARPVWLERGGDVLLASRAALARSVRAALVFDALRGATITVPAARMDIREAVQRAAAVAGTAVKVHVAAPGISLSMRRLYAWLGVESLEVEALCDRLVRIGRPAAA